jgi:hypothetical protein
LEFGLKLPLWGLLMTGGELDGFPSFKETVIGWHRVTLLYEFLDKLRSIHIP